MTADAKAQIAAIGAVEAKVKTLTSAAKGLNSGMGALVGAANPFDLLKGMGENLVGSIPMLGPAFQAAIPAVEHIIDRVKQSEEAITAQGKAAHAVNASMEGYSGLLFAASGNAEVLNKALFKTSVFIATAATEGGKGADTLKSLGLNAKELSGLKTDEVFIRLSGALKATENGYIRNAAAHEIWGKKAEDVMEIVQKGEKGLRDLQARAGRKGLIITEEDVQAIKAADLAMKQLKVSTDGLWNRLAVANAPLKADAANFWGEMFGQGKGGINLDRLSAAAMFQQKFFQNMLSGQFSVKQAIADANASMQQFNDKVAESAELERQHQSELQRTEDLLAKARKQKEEMNRLEAEADKIIASGLTKWEAFQQEIDKIQEAKRKLLIFDFQAEAAMAAALDKMLEHNKQTAKIADHMPEALERGSKAAAEFEFKSQARVEAAFNQGGAENVREQALQALKEMKELNKQQLDRQKEMVKALKDMGLAK